MDHGQKMNYQLFKKNPNLPFSTLNIYDHDRDAGHQDH